MCFLTAPSHAVALTLLWLACMLAWEPCDACANAQTRCESAGVVVCRGTLRRARVHSDAGSSVVPHTFYFCILGERWGGLAALLVRDVNEGMMLGLHTAEHIPVR